MVSEYFNTLKSGQFPFVGLCRNRAFVVDCGGGVIRQEFDPEREEWEIVDVTLDVMIES